MNCEDSAELFPVESRIKGIRFVVAHAGFNNKIHDFMLEYFRVEEPITRSVGSTKEDVFDFFIDLRDAGLKTPCSIVAFDDYTDELVGCCLNEVCDIPEDPSPYEFTGDIYKRQNANKILAFVESLEVDLYSHLRAQNGKRVLKIGVICVHPKYARRGIGLRMCEESLDMARDSNCDYAAASATASASQMLFNKMGFETVHEIFYDAFHRDHELVFKVLHDGVKSGRMMVKSL